MAATAVVAAAFVVGVVAASPAEAATHAASRSAKTNFHFDNIPVRSALQLIAEEGGFNLIVSDSVQGNISLRLHDVTWEQALDLVLKIKGLQQRVDGNTRAVGTAG